MSKTLLYLHTIALVLLSSGLQGQTTDWVVNLASINGVNVTLSADSCKAVLVPSMILSGNYDVDGDGILPPNVAFDIVVQDGNESNGPVIDGCGSWRWRATARATSDGQLVGFTTAWGTLNAEDKTSPTLVNLPTPPTELFCTELNDVNINLLGNSVSRCFEVDGTTGAPIDVDFLDTELGLKLMAGGGLPVFFDACSNITVCVNDVLVNNGTCNDLVINRIFTATDGDCPSVSGETNAPRIAQYPITFTTPSIVSVQPAKATADFDCSLYSLSGPNPQPSEEDFPFIIRADESREYLNVSFCNLGATFSDGPRVVTCANTYKFVRTFTVVDWCPTGTSTTFSQLVKVGDFLGPEITAPTQDLNFDGVADVGPLFFSTNSNDCTSYFLIPNVDVEDDCSDVINVEVTIIPEGGGNSAPLGPYAPGSIAQNIPRGLHTLVYNATDACGNQAIPVMVGLNIDDRTAPVAICEDGLNISIGGSGIAVLRAADINRASRDECGEVTLLISRNGVDFFPSIQIDCDDVSALDANGNPIADLRLSLRVTDESDNVNYCWLDVVVEDKAAPICIAPTPRTVTCAELDGEFPENLEESGLSEEEIYTLLDTEFDAATGIDNCLTTTITQSYEDNRTDCGTGTIVRDFLVTDAQGLTSPATACRQVITILGVHDYTIVFPGDVESDDCIEPNYSGVTFEERGCDLITVATDIDTFLATADECYKLRITYEVLNWCEYDTENPAYSIPRDADQDNMFDEPTYLHVIPVTAATLNDDLAILDQDANPNNTNGSFIANLGTNYGTSGSRGAFRYRQFIKVYDDEAPTLVITTPDGPSLDNDGDCLADTELFFTVGDNCSPDDVSVTAQLDDFIDAGADDVYTLADFVNNGSITNALTNNGGGNYSINLTDQELGRHAVRIIVTDGCGNTTIGLLIFEIEDNKAPTPICINGLTVTLMPDGNGGGMAEIWASDYIASPTTDCSGEVRYAIYRATDAAAAGFEPDVDNVGLTLTCDDDATTIVRIYAIDPAGQSDYCETTLLVQQNDDRTCSGAANVAGTIKTEAGLSVAGVEVSITGTSSAAMRVTGDNGSFSFEDLAAGNDYTLVPYLDRDHINGVSTFDLLKISRHILNLQSLQTPYQYIAADASRNGSITVVDLIMIRRVILGLDDDFENNASWRFIDGTYTFPDPTNPWAENYPTVMNFNNLAGSEIANFMAVKIGDVTGDADPLMAGDGSGLQGSNGRNGSSALVTPTHEFTAGHVIDVPVFAGVDDLIGMQATINLLNGAELIEILDGQAAGNSFGQRMLAEGLLTFSYEAAGAIIRTDEPIFTLRISSRTNAKLNDVLRFNDRITRAEAYTLGGELRNLELTTTPINEVAEVASLYQNVPNPVMEQTMISFDLPVAATVELRVIDLMGRTVLSRKVAGAAGFNQFVLDRSDLGAAGVLSYTLTAGDFSATRQMIVH